MSDLLRRVSFWYFKTCRNVCIPTTDSHVSSVGNASVTVLKYIHTAKATAAGRGGGNWSRTPRMYGVPSGLRNNNKIMANVI